MPVLCVLEPKRFPFVFPPAHTLPKMEENCPYLQVAASTRETACGTQQRRREEGREEIWTFLVSAQLNWI